MVTVVNTECSQKVLSYARWHFYLFLHQLTDFMIFGISLCAINTYYHSSKMVKIFQYCECWEEGYGDIRL